MLATYPPLLATRTVDWSVKTCVRARVPGVRAVRQGEIEQPKIDVFFK